MLRPFGDKCKCVLEKEKDHDGDEYEYERSLAAGSVGKQSYR
jgi:hypothetical protein